MSRVERAEAREERIAKQAETDMQQAQAVRVKKNQKNTGGGGLVHVILVLARLGGAGG